MINRQQSLPLEFVITLKINDNQRKCGNNSFLVPDAPPAPSKIVVKLTDPVSSIFDMIGCPNRQAKLVFNGQILCPTLSFAFYNIHNNDIIDIVDTPITASLSSVDLTPNFSLQEQGGNRQVVVAAPRPIPISHRTRIESNAKNFKKLPPKCNVPPNSLHVNKFPSQTPPPHKLAHMTLDNHHELKQGSIIAKTDSLASNPIPEAACD